MSSCTWTEDESGNWDTSCGNIFTITDGTPSENEFWFCCYCGGSLREERYVDDECTCRARPVRPTDISPPEVTLDKNCPVHGRDPDYERDRQIDDKATGD